MKRSLRPATLASFCLFLLANLAYFVTFVNANPPQDYASVEEYISVFFYPVNYDYLKYVYIFDHIERGIWIDLFSPNFGISFAYVTIHRFVPLDYGVLALVVNTVVFSLCYYYVIRILKAAKLSTRYSYLFFLNPQLIFYSQVINKEPPTLFFVLLLTSLVLERKKAAFILATLAATMLRGQLLIFAVFLYFLYGAKNYRRRLSLVYLASAIGATILAITSASQNADTFSDSRFVKFIFDLNTKYYIGNLVFAPLKLVQWVYEQLRSLIFITPDGYVNLYLFRDVGAIIVLAAVFRRTMRILVHPRHAAVTNQRILVSAIYAFTFTLLINPMVHQRYLFPIEMLMIMLGLSSLRKRTEPVKIPVAKPVPTGGRSYV